MKKPDTQFLPKSEVAFSPSATTDFSSFISKIMNSKADGVLISLWGGNLIDFVRQASDMGFFDGKREVLMTLGAATEVLYALKDKMPEGLWVGTRYWFQANDSPVNKAFVDAYSNAFEVLPVLQRPRRLCGREGLCGRRREGRLGRQGKD